MGGRARTLVWAAGIGLLALGVVVLTHGRGDGDGASDTTAAAASTRGAGGDGRSTRRAARGASPTAPWPRGKGAAARDDAAAGAARPSPDALTIDPPEPEPGAPAWDERWLAAWQADARRYGPAELERIEDLYRSGGDDFDSAEGRETLADLVEQYPDSNRAGCAAMNLGGAYLEEGDLDEAQYWLEEVISSESGAVFGNGEAVLAKALFHYGALWQARGDLDRARQAWLRLRDELGGETDARGTPYGELVADLLDPPE